MMTHESIPSEDFRQENDPSRSFISTMLQQSADFRSIQNGTTGMHHKKAMNALYQTDEFHPTAFGTTRHQTPTTELYQTVDFHSMVHGTVLHRKSVNEERPQNVELRRDLQSIKNILEMANSKLHEHRRDDIENLLREKPNFEIGSKYFFSVTDPSATSEIEKSLQEVLALYGNLLESTESQLREKDDIICQKHTVIAQQHATIEELRRDRNDAFVQLRKQHNTEMDEVKKKQREVEAQHLEERQKQKDQIQRLEGALRNMGREKRYIEDKYRKSEEIHRSELNKLCGESVLKKEVSRGRARSVDPKPQPQTLQLLQTAKIRNPRERIKELKELRIISPLTTTQPAVPEGEADTTQPHISPRSPKVQDMKAFFKSDEKEVSNTYKNLQTRDEVQGFREDNELQPFDQIDDLEAQLTLSDISFSTDQSLSDFNKIEPYADKMEAKESSDAIEYDQDISESCNLESNANGIISNLAHEQPQPPKHVSAQDLSSAIMHFRRTVNPRNVPSELKCPTTLRPSQSMPQLNELVVTKDEKEDSIVQEPQANKPSLMNHPKPPLAGWPPSKSETSQKKHCSRPLKEGLPILPPLRNISLETASSYEVPGGFRGHTQLKKVRTPENKGNGPVLQSHSTSGPSGEISPRNDVEKSTLSYPHFQSYLEKRSENKEALSSAPTIETTDTAEMTDDDWPHNNTSNRACSEKRKDISISMGNDESDIAASELSPVNRYESFEPLRFSKSFTAFENEGSNEMMLLPIKASQSFDNSVYDSGDNSGHMTNVESTNIYRQPSISAFSPTMKEPMSESTYTPITTCSTQTAAKRMKSNLLKKRLISKRHREQHAGQGTTPQDGQKETQCDVQRKGQNSTQKTGQNSTQKKGQSNLPKKGQGNTQKKGGQGTTQRKGQATAQKKWQGSRQRKGQGISQKKGQHDGNGTPQKKGSGRGGYGSPQKKKGGVNVTPIENVRGRSTVPKVVNQDYAPKTACADTARRASNFVMRRRRLSLSRRSQGDAQ